MAAAQRHRGPDADSVSAGPRHVVHFSRLAVNAVSDGEQPFISADGLRLTVVTGEIYNHGELRRRYPGPVSNASDCSVIADLAPVLGDRLFAELRGMFAALMIDLERRRIRLVRDPFGIKPLFWSRQGDRLFVASELKGLFASRAVPTEPDWGAALRESAFLSARRGTLRDDISHFRHAHAVPPGSLLTIALDDGATTSHRFLNWTVGQGTNHSDGVDGLGCPEGGRRDLAGRAHEYTQEYARLLHQAAARACMADRPMTVMLSGGVDSLAVAALAARHRPTAAPLTAWTVLAPSTVEGDHPAAVRAAREVGLDLRWVDTREAERHAGLAAWCWLLQRCETPLAGPEQYYKLALLHAARESADPFAVVLTGQGSDEFNGGYSRDFSHPTPTGAPGGWAGFLDALDLGRTRHILDRLPGAVRASGTGLPERWLRTDWLLEQAPNIPADPYEYWIRSMLASLQQYNCWHEDRTAAAFSAETRPVFLDVDLVTHALSIPPAMRPKLLWDKRILRDALRPLLPPTLAGAAERPKAPFHMQAQRRTALGVMVNILERDADDLVELATSGPTAAHVLDADGMRQGIQYILSDPELGGFEQLTRLLSLGALETLLAPDSPPTAPDDSIHLATVTGTTHASTRGSTCGSDHR